MSDLSRLETALHNADAAGDIEAAQSIAAELRQARAAPTTSALGTFGAEAQNAALFGLDDRIGAFGGALLGREVGGGPTTMGANTAGSFSDRYSAHLAHEQDETDARREAHPYAAAGGAIAGSILPGVGMAKAGMAAGRAVGMAPAQGMMRKGAEAAAAGGAMGGVVAFNEARPGERGRDAAIGAAIGAPLGVAGGILGAAVQRGYRSLVGNPRLYDSRTGRITDAGRQVLVDAGVEPGDISDGLARRFAEQASRAIDDTAAARTAVADEFGIPLTRGQSTGDVADIAFEEAARNEARGASAGRIMRGFDDRQGQAVGSARTDMASHLSGTDAALTPQEGAAGVVSGVKGASRNARQAADDAYGSIAPGSAIIDKTAYPDLQARAAEALEFETLTPSPAAANAMKEIDRLIAAVNGKTSPDGDVVGVDFLAVERARQRLGKIAARTRGSDPQGAAEVRTIVRAMDEWVGEAFEKSLIHGDDAALDNIRNARSLWQQYKTTFSKQGRHDDAGGIMERIVETDMGPQEAANLLYGAGKVGLRKESARVAKRLRSVLGPDSPEFASIRSGAFQRALAMDGANELGPRASATRLVDFSKTDLARSLYTAKELGQMRRFASVMRYLVPPPEATNPSKTGYAVSRLGSDMMQNFAGMLGFAGGDMATGLALRLSSAIPGALRNRSQARGAVAPPRRPTTDGRQAGAAAAGNAGASAPVAANEPRSALR